MTMRERIADGKLFTGYFYRDREITEEDLAEEAALSGRTE